MAKSRNILALFIVTLFIASGLAGAEETLTWQDCIAEARKNNPDLISAVEGVSEQKAAKGVTASDLFPQITADMDASTAKTATTSATTNITTSKVSDTYSYGVSGTQLIFDGLKTINKVNAASEEIKSAQQNYRFVSSDVRLSLRNAFVNLLKSQELIKVEDDIARIRRDNLELITLRYQSGLEHKGALLTAEANLAQANFGLNQAKRDVESAQRQLTKALGRREFKPMQVKADFSVKDAPREKPDLESLAKVHPSLLQATAVKNSALFSLKSTYGNFLPKLTGSAGADKTGPDWAPKNKQWNLGLSLSLPIFEGGLRIAQVAQARAIYNQAEADERSTRDTTIVNLEQAWVRMRDAQESVGVQRKTLEAAQERSNIAEAQYSTGFITFDNWIIIQDDLVNAKRAYLDARAEALLAEANWIKAKGETLEYAQ